MKPDFNFRYYKENYLIALIIVLYIASEALIRLISHVLNIYDLSYNRFYPAAILLAILFSLINTNLHRFQKLWNLLIKVPFVKGEYEGEIHYTINDTPYTKKCFVKISQTTSKIKITSKFWEEDENSNKILITKTPSQSIVEDFRLNKNDIYELNYYYRNDGNFNSTIPIKEGYNILKYNKSTQSFEGRYFSKNSITDGNGGTIKLVKIKNKKG
ncbi:hypothetical protein [uncultured Winogradskyella sp.]|uniref:Cap15 family cyclic dinucleotide receptor domain-containing protein n=1 Tax=uncultured Winogradskyella sp. TaxID=395353 RepID=UPI002617A2DB|nr:hypothetical protein [uncultured Winogradskyella sp.]